MLKFAPVTFSLICLDSREAKRGKRGRSESSYIRAAEFSLRFGAAGGGGNLRVANIYFSYFVSFHTFSSVRSCCQSNLFLASDWTRSNVFFFSGKLSQWRKNPRRHQNTSEQQNLDFVYCVFILICFCIRNQINFYSGVFIQTEFERKIFCFD